jgi:hypothetical protein
MVWSEWAYRHGPTALYDLPPDSLINTQLPQYLSAQPVVTPFPSTNPCNYPPLSSYLFWFQGWMWRTVDSRLETHPLSPEVARFVGVEGGQLTSPVANTVVTRGVNATAPALADFLTAWGVVMLVSALRRRPAGWPEAIAFALAVLAPPIVLNSAFWTQLDSCLVCLLVWCVYFLVAERDIWAGVCFGAALVLKAQAILLLPVLVFIFLGRMLMPGGSLRSAVRMWKAAVAALIVVLVVTTPHMLSARGTGEAGPARWFNESYVVPIQKQYPLTTLKAFNIWWLDFLARLEAEAPLRPDAPAFGGVTKDQLGRALLLAAIVVSGGLCAWRWKWRPTCWVAFAFLVAFAAFLLPTRVHERYILYCLPFLIAGAIVFRPWIPLLVSLFVVAGFEMTWFLWLVPPQAPPGAPPKTGDAALLSLALAAVSVLSLVYALVVLPFGVRRDRSRVARG